MERRALAALRGLLRDLAATVRTNVDVRLWDGSVVPMGPRAADAPPAAATITIRDPAAIAALARRPSLATLFEAIASGLIDSDDASPLMIARNWDHMDVVRFTKRLGVRGFATRLWPFLFLPTAPRPGLEYHGGERGAEIRHHYDVSNEFYRLFLDERMVYSCAHFARPDMTLDEAQAAKLETCCRKLRLRPGARMLDIGCGWGALAIHAARHHGARVVGVTLSAEQHALAVANVAEAGLADRIEIRLVDWREVVDGSFDAVVQVGMFEHVAEADQTDFLAAVHRLLAPEGVYLHHAITARADRARRRPGPYMKVIRRFIFPGGHLDPIGRTLASMEAARLEVHDVEGWRSHYARTCAEWSERLWARREEAIALVGPGVTRMWLLYLCMVTIGFERSVTFIYQTVATRRRIGPSPLPPSRSDLYERPL